MKYKIFINTILITGALSNSITLSAMEDWNREAPETPKNPSSSERTSALESENKKKQEEAAATEAARKTARTQSDWEAQRRKPLPANPVAQPIKPPPATETVQKKPGFSFREFFGFGKKDEVVPVSYPKINAAADVEIDQNLKPISASVVDLKKLGLKEIERLLKQVQAKNLTHKDIQWVTAYSDKILEISPERLKDYSLDMQRKMLNIINMRGTLVNTANNMILKIEEAESSGGTAVDPSQKRQQNQDARKRLSELYFVEYSDDIKDMGKKINDLSKKVITMQCNLELRESARKLKNAKKSQIGKEGISFCNTFVSAFKRLDISQQDEISKLSMSTLRQVAPNFLTGQRNLIETLTTQIGKLESKELNDPMFKYLSHRLDLAQESVHIIESVLKEFEDRKKRVTKLKAMKEKELADDKQTYLELETKELALENNPTSINQRKLMNIRIQKKELEDKYGQAPTQFKTLKDAIQANK